MRITININKSVEENAAVYFEKSKKAKKKLKGAKKTLDDYNKKLDDAIKKAEKEAEQLEKKRQLKERKKSWYEKFRWFISSEGFLVIGGRDATTNEIVIKKHTDEKDLVFHTSMSGSPFFVIKSEGKDIGEQTIKEAAIATASFSKAWKLGMPSAEVLSVNPDQVSKEAAAGEFIPKGAFMIRGKTNKISSKCDVAVGIKDKAVMAGPESAVKKHCKDYIKLKQGKSKTSEIAKKIQKKLGGDLDEIIRAIPEGSDIA